MLRKRIVAALFGLPLIFVSLYFNFYLRAHGSVDDWPLFVILMVIGGASSWEVANVVRNRFPGASLWNGLYTALLIPFVVHAIRVPEVFPGIVATNTSLSGAAILVDSLGATAMIMLLFLGVWGDIENRGKDGIKENLWIISGGLYIGINISFILLLQGMLYHELGVAMLFILVFGLDTAAYFVGKRFGGIKLFPKLSPKKTVAGAVGGLIFATLIASLFPLIPAIERYVPAFSMHINWPQAMLIGVIIGIIGQVGDLLESLFKRWGGVKDSGAALPGHGGYLDRFDSLFLAAPVCYFLFMGLVK